MTFPDGAAVTYTLDAANRMTAATYASVQRIGQTYNSLGQLTAITRGTTGSTTYGYDATGRVTAMAVNLPGSTAPDAGWTFGYSPSGQLNLLSTDPAYTSTSQYDYKEKASTTVAQTWDGLNRDAAIAAISGGYDARGNLTKDGVRTFTYDIENRLLTKTSPTDGQPNITLAYDPEGRLVRAGSVRLDTQRAEISGACQFL